MQGNWHSQNNSCVTGEKFQAIVTRAEGFQWVRGTACPGEGRRAHQLLTEHAACTCPPPPQVNEGADGGRAKWGSVGTAVGAQLEVELNTNLVRAR